MTNNGLSKAQLAELRQTMKDVAERVVVLLSEQVASQDIDSEAAEDFVIWADEQLQEIDQVSADEMEAIAGGISEGWQGHLDVALTGRGLIRGQTGFSRNPHYVEQCRDMQRITQMATLFAETIGANPERQSGSREKTNKPNDV